jgi:hypothetical protein
MSFNPRFLATGIGSMPFEDVEHAVDVSLSRVSQAPFWPQMPRLSLKEQMEIQYSEGMPRAVIDLEKKRMFFDTSGDYSEDFAAFYEVYMTAMDEEMGTGDFTSMAISPDFSRGIYALEKRLLNRGGKLPCLKVQTTGLCSFALTIVDESKRALYYNEEFRDMIVKALAMKCRWQIRKFQAYAERVICFIDEPILSAFGSSTYVAVTREDVVALLQEMIKAVHRDHALAGIHCCGNTEWSILMDAGVDIVNFDAYDFGETIAMYPEAVKAHLERGGALAWGIVPTSVAIRNESVESLEGKLEKLMDHLASRGIDKKLILDQAMITPSCGTGSLDPGDAERVFEILDLLSKEMRKKYGFA